MKKLLALFLLILLTMPAMAQLKKHNLEIGYEVAGYKYKEPGLMSLKSNHKQGVSAQYTFLSAPGENGFLFGAEFRYLQGNVDYDGGTWDGDPLYFEDLKDYYMDGAIRVGRTYNLGERTNLLSYTGLGLRRLRNHLEQSGEGGYLRQSTYLYVPIGAQLVYGVPNDWQLRLAGEVDFLVYGRQESYFDDSFGKISNDQHNGVGVRVSVKAEKSLGVMGVFVEPFWRYWKLEDSDTVTVYTPGDTYYLQEPENHTTEYGVRIGITF